LQLGRRNRRRSRSCWNRVAGCDRRLGLRVSTDVSERGPGSVPGTERRPALLLRRNWPQIRLEDEIQTEHALREHLENYL
jgi:hypothetical protein